MRFSGGFLNNLCLEWRFFFEVLFEQLRFGTDVFRFAFLKKKTTFGADVFREVVRTTEVWSGVLPNGF